MMSRRSTAMTKILALHHVTAAPTIPVGPEVDVGTPPSRLAAILEAHADWARVDHLRGLDPRRVAERSLLITLV